MQTTDNHFAHALICVTGLGVLTECDAPQKKARESRGAEEGGRQEAPSTPVPSDARLASVAEELQRKKESQQAAAKVGLSPLREPGVS